MAREAAVGTLPCPVCPYPDAEVRKDRNGHLYVYCPDCSVQVFTRGCRIKEAGLAAKMTPISVDIRDIGHGRHGVPVELVAESTPTPTPATTPTPKKRGLIL